MDVGEKMVKAYIEPREGNRAHGRVVKALAQYAPPSVEIVTDLETADLVILHIIGRQERVHRRVEHLRARRQGYAIIQYCLRSTQRPSTENWFPLWRDAVLVWSYYDLNALCMEDGTSQDFPFYHAPLGVDSMVFYPRHVPRRYVIMTSGLSWLTESVREAAFAAKRVGRPVLHLGPEVSRPWVTCVSGMDDNILANLYSQCEFVSGLRRVEGFELPAAEGLLCGARPICYDRPHYRQWFGPWAVFVPETTRAPIIDDLESVFRSGARPVTGAERKAAKMWFDWNKIVTGFWRGVLDA